MAFRTEAGAFLAGLFAAAILNAQSVAAKHDHLYGAGAGTLTVSDDGMVWEETGKSKKHSRAWNWDDIQQLDLSAERVRILCYNDDKWRGWRDREYEIAGTTGSFAAAIDPLLRRNLGAKYVAMLGALPDMAQWRIPAKLRERLGGTEGVLAFTGDRLIYSTHTASESRTLPLGSIESISSGDHYELTVETPERAGWTRGPRELHFQLKRPITEQQYQSLWKAVNGAKDSARNFQENSK